MEDLYFFWKTQTQWEDNLETCSWHCCLFHVQLPRSSLVHSSLSWNYLNQIVFQIIFINKLNVTITSDVTNIISIFYANYWFSTVVALSIIPQLIWWTVIKGGVQKYMKPVCFCFYSVGPVADVCRFVCCVILLIFRTSLCTHAAQIRSFTCHACC